MKELVKIQTELKANKDLFNQFGGYGYRSTESILEAVKHLLVECNCTIVISDEMLLIGDRFYVKATATIKNEKNETESASAYAREPLNKKGMDESQLTGSSSSYARKYALCGLLAIDDRRDADSMNAGEKNIPDAKLKSEFVAISKKLDGCKTKEDVVALNDKAKDLWDYPPYIQKRDQKWSVLPNAVKK